MLNRLKESKPDISIPGISNRMKALEASVFQVNQRLNNTVKGLKNDTLALKGATNDMSKIIIHEAKVIKKAFAEYGISISSHGNNVAKGGYGVAAEAQAGAREIKPALEKVKLYARRAKGRAGRRDYIGALFSVYDSLRYMAWSGTGGQQAVMWEVIEAFNAISNAFNQFSGGLKGFARVSKTAPDKLGTIMNNSWNNISNAMTNVSLSFVRVAENMSVNLG